MSNEIKCPFCNTCQDIGRVRVTPSNGASQGRHSFFMDCPWCRGDKTKTDRHLYLLNRVRRYENYAVGFGIAATVLAVLWGTCVGYCT